MVGVVQWLERQIVALEVVGSTPITHPIFLLRHTIFGVSPSGKAPDFDSGIRRFDPCHPSHGVAGFTKLATPLLCKDISRPFRRSAFPEKACGLSRGGTGACADCT